jgi:hypothetical protein
LLLFAAFSFLFICIPWKADLIYPRYALPVEVILVLLAGGFVESVVGRVRTPQLRQGIYVTVAVLAILPPVVRTVGYAVLLGRADTRTLAREWVHENIPEGASIVLEGRGYGVSPNTVPLDNLPANVTATVERYRQTDPRWLIDPDYQLHKDRFHDAAVAALEGKRCYNLISTESATLSYGPLERYIERGAEYLIIDPEKLGRFSEGVNYRRFPMVGDFYRDILESPRLERMKRFEPAGRLGPTLEIYRIKEGP